MLQSFLSTLKRGSAFGTIPANFADDPHEVFSTVAPKESWGYSLGIFTDVHQHVQLGGAYEHMWKAFFSCKVLREVPHKVCHHMALVPHLQGISTWKCCQLLVLCHEQLHGSICNEHCSDFAMDQAMWVVMCFPHMGQRQHQAFDLGCLALELASVLFDKHIDLAEVIEAVTDPKNLIGFLNLLPNVDSVFSR